MVEPAASLIENMGDVDSLFELHVQATGTKSGRRYGVEVLNKSAIVLVTACWEAFVEDVALTGAQFIAERTKNAAFIPLALRKALCARVRDDKHELAAWKLAGLGWRSMTKDHVASLVERLNTPRAELVDQVFEKSLGIPRISDTWHWRGTSPEAARKKLDALVTLRGGIAHRVRGGGPVRKQVAVDYASFVVCLAVQTSNAARTHIESITGSSPWDEVETVK